MGSKKVRFYDLAKELKIENKKAIEEIRREGVDVSVPSNSVPDDVAERIRNKYYPKKHAAPAAPRLVKAARPASGAGSSDVSAPESTLPLTRERTGEPQVTTSEDAQPGQGQQPKP